MGSGSGFCSNDSIMTQSSFCLTSLGTDRGAVEMESKLGEEVDSSGWFRIGYNKWSEEKRKTRKRRKREAKKQMEQMNERMKKQRNEKREEEEEEEEEGLELELKWLWIVEDAISSLWRVRWSLEVTKLRKSDMSFSCWIVLWSSPVVRWASSLMSCWREFWMIRRLSGS